MTPDKKGFTLLELIVVMVIVMIMAAVAAPMMITNKKRTIASEAVVALGALRTFERIYYVENQQYTGTISDLSLQASDLNGAYFSKECYKAWVHGGGYSQVFVWCHTSLSQAPKANEVKNWTFSGSFPMPYIGMDENGVLWGDIDGLGYPRNPGFED